MAQPYGSMSKHPEKSTSRRYCSFSDKAHFKLERSLKIKVIGNMILIFLEKGLLFLYDAVVEEQAFYRTIFLAQ